jgi:tetratricopeptide (TPR) repeat protein
MWTQSKARHVVIALALAGAVAWSAPAAAETSSIDKDPGPAGTCDRYERSGPAWTACLGAARAGMPAAELFYAGYWLARSGRYEEALGYLALADQRDARVATYIGFATRKLGDVDAALPHYARALAINPDYTVARAYLGEAWLAKGEPGKARAELGEIERRCGTACAEYADLAQHIKVYETARAKRG